MPRVHTTIAVTGSRYGATDAQRDVLTRWLTANFPDVLFHGCCKGVDETVVQILNDLNHRLPADGANPLDPVGPRRHEFSRRHCRIIAYPSTLPQWTSDDAKRKSFTVYDPLPPLVRNEIIVRRSSLLVACPRDFRLTTGGTAYTVRYARREKRKIVIMWPNGDVAEEN